MEALVIFIAIFGVFLALINIFVTKDKDPLKLADWLERHAEGEVSEEGTPDIYPDAFSTYLATGQPSLEPFYDSFKNPRWLSLSGAIKY
ncbi:MAG: hypothetical protein HY730_00260 [Candidatus Tectomicrobia bacterium]|uniref:Uncharacterized protein n=1 Tax=Tectimicrobiota bacterium TaxID=2528274 RepID=A0A933LP58_UNCTE|nr:hypothetical protein [Candidatus Tectomicrobia bacterium]